MIIANDHNISWGKNDHNNFQLALFLAPFLVLFVSKMSRRGDSADTIALSPPPSMERRGSRARRRMLTVDTGLAEATCNNNGGGSETGQEYGAGGEEDDNPPVIDTTSVEVERKADGERHIW